MTLDKIIDALRPLDTTGPTDAEVTGVVTDSRQARPGCVFVAIPGRRADGWVYRDDAMQRGACAVVTQHDDPVRDGVCRVRVQDARRAAARAASVFHGHPADRMGMVGITGTNGKTTSAYMVRAILEAAGRRPGLLSTVVYEIGARVIPAGRTTPEAPDLQRLLSQMVAAGCRSVAMEVSSHALDQDRAADIDFDVAVFTNLTRDHLDYHGTMESYFDAKQKLFRSLGQGTKAATAVVCTDGEWGRRLARMPWHAAPVVTTGLGGTPDVGAEGLSLTAKGSRFRLFSPWGAVDVRLPLMGRHNVVNALSALGACGALGVDMALAAEALSGLVRVPGRLERVPIQAPFDVYVDYAHTDDALAHALETLREITAGRLVVVFGCGGNRDRSKRPEMGRVAAAGADATVLTSDNPRREDPKAILAEIRAGFDSGKPLEIVEDRRAAIRRALDLARPGDAVLIAGKGHETFQEFANTSAPFDDRQVALELAAERSW
jgi:UDP-N-acetylmuramoyl-L-alanyl-D-glutamate--2,6-diaminopimelate ligase